MKTPVKKRRRSLRLLLVAPFLAPFLALGLVVTTPTPSGAVPVSPMDFIPIPPAVAVGETLPFPGSAVTATCAGAVALCLGLASAGVLWMTRDHWWPVAKNVLTSAYNFLTGNGGGCAVSAAASPLRAGSATLAVDIQWSGCSTGAGWSSNYLQLESYASATTTASALCKAGDVVYPPNVTSRIAIGGPYRVAAGTIAATWDICGGAMGGELVYAKGYAQLGNAPARGTSMSFVIGAPVPVTNLAQTTKVHCKAADGTDHWMEKSLLGSDGKILMPSCEDVYGPGSYPTEADFSSGWQGAENPIGHVDMGNPAAEYPDCFSSTGVYLNTCRVRVWINGQPCAVGVAICTNWSTAEQDNPGTEVECKWGPYVVPIGDCSMLQQSYGPNAGPKVITEPQTEVKPGIEDPTWTDIFENLCLVNCDPPVIPPVCTGSDCVPNEPPVAEGNCMSGAWSFNPIKLVYVPVKCVLIWAFVPDEDEFQDALDRVKGPLEDALGPWSDAIDAAFAGVSGGSGCSGPTVTMPASMTRTGFPGSWQPLNACSGKMKTIADLSHLIATVFLTVFTVVKAFDLIAGGLGIAPSRRVVATGGESA